MAFLRLLRLVHIFCAMLASSCVVLAATLGPEIYELDLYRNRGYRSLQHFAGVGMIFSGVFYVLLLK